MAQDVKRDYRFDNLKSLMIIGIVFEHSLIMYGYPKDFEMIWALLISPLMPLFTIISGYFYKKHTLKELSERYLYPMLLFSSVNFRPIGQNGW